MDSKDESRSTSCTTPTLCIRVDKFIKAFLPPLPDGVSVEDVSRALANDSESENPWNHFSVFPKEMKDASPELNEDQLFSNFTLPIQRLAAEASKTSRREQTFEYAANPTKTPSVPERASSF